MIELVLTFVAGFIYALAGMALARKLDPMIQGALIAKGVDSPAVNVYASTAVTVAWPLLGIIMAFTTAYATLRGASE